MEKSIAEKLKEFLAQTDDVLHAVLVTAHDMGDGSNDCLLRVVVFEKNMDDVAWDRAAIILRSATFTAEQRAINGETAQA